MMVFFTTAAFPPPVKGHNAGKGFFEEDMCRSLARRFRLQSALIPDFGYYSLCRKTEINAFGGYTWIS